MWFVDRLGKKEFEYVSFTDEDRENDKKTDDDEHKYTEVIHSKINFDFTNTPDRYDFLTLYVFFAGTFVWFNEFLSIFIKQDNFSQYIKNNLYKQLYTLNYFVK